MKNEARHAMIIVDPDEWRGTLTMQMIKISCTFLLSGYLHHDRQCCRHLKSGNAGLHQISKSDVTWPIG